MNVADFENFRDLLTGREQNLSEWLHSGEPIDEADARRVRDLLGQIKEALGRIEDHTYGTCKVCHGEVELERLQVQPVTEVCLDCISKEEKTRLEEELFMAGKIHRALLPQDVEKIAGFDVAAHSRTARTVGGDYYDFLPSRNGSPVRVVIADSMGKGLPAGLVMSNFQGALRVLADEVDSPAVLISRLNGWLTRNIPVTKFITLACIELRPQADGTTKLVHANAGHCPSIVARKDGTIELLEATGTVIGVHEDFKYEETSLTLSPGDLLVLYTDGVTEAENHQGEMYDDGRLCRFVRDNRQAPLETFLDNLLADIQKFTGTTELSDDLTVIALRKQE